MELVLKLSSLVSDYFCAGAISAEHATHKGVGGVGSCLAGQCLHFQLLAEALDHDDHDVAIAAFGGDKGAQQIH